MNPKKLFKEEDTPFPQTTEDSKLLNNKNKETYPGGNRNKKGNKVHKMRTR